jgi:hypothetical protein
MSACASGGWRSLPSSGGGAIEGRVAATQYPAARAWLIRLSRGLPGGTLREAVLFDRFARSWELAGECLRLLMQDKRLLVLPLLSTIAIVVLTASFAVPLAPLLRSHLGSGSARGLSTLTYVGLFLFYWLQYTVIIFFNTALVEVAMRRFDGEDARIGDGLRRAVSLLPVILVYAAIAASVGTLLRLIAERVGIVGRIVVGLIGFVWSVATALVVPVLAAENVGPIEAIGRSAELIKKAWGEDIIGNVGIGFAFGLVMVGTVLVGGLLVMAAFGAQRFTLGVLLLVLAILAVCLLALAQATLQGIYSAALYRYATGDPATGGIDRDLLDGAFRARG